MACLALVASYSTVSSNYFHCTKIRTTCRKILLLGDGMNIACNVLISVKNIT
nr:MAG TPA: hypothetical protein [Caudoviricetes sp.]